jgi:hypothetical protein
MADGAVPAVVPSSPDPATVTLVAALLRHLLTLLSGVGFLGGLVINDGMLLTIASSLVGIATIAWSLFEKFQAKRKDHAGSVMSADLHRPVQPA